jgi:hypothetical protein
MSILLETIAYVAGAGSILGLNGLRALKTRKTTPEVEDSSYEFLWRSFQSGYEYGYRCPKCISYKCNKKDYPICSDYCYPKMHFHFKCNSCGFETIMRTADNK